jgi:hypothetical protein
MKVMKVIAYVICGLGLFGSVMLLAEENVADGVLGAMVYGYFLAFTVKAN